MSIQRAPSRLLDYANIADATPKELVGDFDSGLLYLVKPDKSQLAIPLVKSVFELTKGDTVIATYDPKGTSKVTVDISQLISGTDPISVSDGVISHAASGVAANSYGDTTNQTPGYGGSFKVPSFTVDANGHLTVAGVHTVTLPAAPTSAETANKLTTARTITLSGRANGSTSFDGSGNVTINTTLSGVVTNYSATIPNSGWSGSNPYRRTISVSGMLASDTPIADVVCSGTYATDQSRIEEWGKIYRITTAANSITVYATAVPTVAIPITLKCIRN